MGATTGLTCATCGRAARTMEDVAMFATFGAVFGGAAGAYVGSHDSKEKKCRKWNRQNQCIA